MSKRKAKKGKKMTKKKGRTKSRVGTPLDRIRTLI